jgi:hypothetical protein
LHGLKRWRCIAEAARAWVAEENEKEMPVRLFLGFLYHISYAGGLGEAALPFRFTEKNPLRSHSTRLWPAAASATLITSLSALLAGCSLRA